MGSASGPDDARRLDADRDGTPEPLNQTESRASDLSADDRFYEETDGVFPDGEIDGYVEDTAGPADESSAGPLSIDLVSCSEEGILLSIPIDLPIPSLERLPQVKLAVR